MDACRRWRLPNQQQRRRLFERCGWREHAFLQHACGPIRRRDPCRAHVLRHRLTDLPIRQRCDKLRFQQNPLLTTANCTNPGPQFLTAAGLPTKTVCYPQNHQANVKLFDLKTNTYVAAFPTGGGCMIRASRMRWGPAFPDSDGPMYRSARFVCAAISGRAERLQRDGEPRKGWFHRCQDRGG